MTNNHNERGYLYILQLEKPSIIRFHKDGFTDEIIVDNLKGVPDGIQIDRNKGVIYWTNMGGDFNAQDGSVESIGIDGRNRCLLVGSGQITTPKQLALDENGEYLYWCDREGGESIVVALMVMRLTVLVDRTSGLKGSVDILDQCVGIAIDRKRSKLYWTQKGPSKGGKGCIFSANIEIPSGETAQNRSDIATLYSDLPEPIDLEIDEDNNYLYWTDRGADPNGNSLNRASIVEEGLCDHKVIVTGFEEAIGLALDLENRCAYVSDLGGSVYKVNLENGYKRVIYKSGSLTGIVIF